MHWQGAHCPCRRDGPSVTARGAASSESIPAPSWSWAMAGALGEGMFRGICPGEQQRHEGVTQRACHVSCKKWRIRDDVALARGLRSQPAAPRIPGAQPHRGTAPASTGSTPGVLGWGQRGGARPGHTHPGTHTWAHGPWHPNPWAPTAALALQSRCPEPWACCSAAGRAVAPVVGCEMAFLPAAPLNVCLNIEWRLKFQYFS